MYAINTNICTLDRFRSKSSRITAGKIDNCSRDKIVLYSMNVITQTHTANHIHSSEF